MPFCQVIVDINHTDVDHVFTYRVPAGLDVCPGMRVHVPFGPRKLEGVVVEMAADCDLPPERVKDICDTLEDYPAVLPPLLELAKEIQRTSFCTLAVALRLMFPAQMRGQRIREKQQEVAVLTVAPDVLGQVIAAQVRAPKRAKVLRALADAPDMELTTAALRETVGDCRDALNALCRMGFVKLEKRESLRRPYGEMERLSAQDPELTRQQEDVLAELLPAVETGKGEFLLYGVTGSGKTEVYLHVVRQALLRGKGAILLVPEIALTPQMVSWFRSRFGDTAAVLHSGLSQGEKYDEWRRIRRGEARVVIGARSAVFAPVSSLGLILIDEEHESTYRSDTHPCYDARQVARERCRLEHASLVLGSATPSIDTYARTLHGQNVLLEMRERVAGRPLPEVEIVDMRKELVSGNRSIFSRALHDALEETLMQGRQAVLFHNRRGYSSFVKCRACGYTVHCPHCDVTMTYHSVDDTVKCHYCGTEMTSPKVCPACGSPYIRKFGVGTQQVEEKLKQEFPYVKTVRLDNDTTRGKDDLVRLLTAFRKGEAQVLIGTQMIAKGHDFPNVTLVGVIAADMTLNLPDYRSEERTFQLLTQVEGRAGRGVFPGRVIVQSYEPDHYAVRMAATQDYRAFYDEEIRRRRRRLYPPYTLMMRILLTGAEQSDVRASAEVLEMQVSDWFAQSKIRRNQMIQVHAMEAPLGRIRDEYRYQVFIKMYAKGSDEAVDAIAQLVRESECPGVRVDMELNPASFM